MKLENIRLEGDNIVVDFTKDWHCCQRIHPDRGPLDVSHALQFLSNRIRDDIYPLTLIAGSGDIRVCPRHGSMGNFNYERVDGRWFVYTSMGEKQELGCQPLIDITRFNFSTR